MMDSGEVNRCYSLEYTTKIGCVYGVNEPDGTRREYQGTFY